MDARDEVIPLARRPRLPGCQIAIEVALRLTHFKLCPFSRSIRLVLGEFGFRPDVEDVQPWSLKKPFLTKNPAGTLPVLETPSGRILIGAYATAEFFNDVLREDDASDAAVLEAWLGVAAEATTVSSGAQHDLALFPGDADDRAEVRRLVDWFHLKFDREVTQEFLIERVQPILDRAKARAPDAGLMRAARANLKYHLSYIGFLADQRRWLAGDALSYADFAAAAHLSVADYLGEIAWEDAPFAQAWYQRVKSRPAFRGLLEDRVPGLSPPPHYPELDF